MISKFDYNKMKLDLLTESDRTNYIYNLSENLLPKAINKIGKYFNTGIYINPSGLEEMKLVNNHTDLSTKGGLFTIDRKTKDYEIALNECCIFTYYTPVLNYIILHELTHFTQLLLNDRSFEKCYEFISPIASDLNIEELKYSPNHKLNFTTRVAEIFDGVNYKRIRYGILPSNIKFNPDRSKSHMLDISENLVSTGPIKRYTYNGDSHGF